MRLLWILLLLSTEARAATNVAASVSRSDVQATIDASAAGDTVEVPAGGALWTNGITITNDIRLIGDVAATNTWITNNLTSGPLILISGLTTNTSPRVAYLRFVDGGQVASLTDGIIQIAGDTSNYRFDHLWVDGVRNMFIKNLGYSRGLIDHCYWTHSAWTKGIIHFFHTSWAGGSQGDESWSEPFSMGSTNQVIVEDCQFVYTGTATPAVTDSYGGARFTFRYNYLERCICATHGTGDGSGRKRGPPHQEFYRNTYVDSVVNAKNIIHIRGGTGIVFGERATNYTKGPSVHHYRLDNRTCSPFGIPPNAFDIVDVSDGAGTPGGAGDGVFEVGLAGAGSGNVTLEVPGAGWTDNQWLGYIVVVSNSSVHPEGRFSASVASNDADTIVVGQNNFTNACPHIFIEGEGFSLMRILMGFDGIGGGPTLQLLDKSTTPTPTNLQQRIQPYALWDNTLDGVADTNPGHDPHVFTNFHFYMATIGTYEDMLAFTPTIPNTAITSNAPFWFATNSPHAENWNTINGTTNDGALYWWSNSTWTFYYRPAPYPDPRAGGEAPPAPPPPPDPGNPRIVRANSGRVQQMLVQ